MAAANAEPQERYYRIFETSKDAIFLIDASSGIVLDVNARATDMLGYSREELKGLEIWHCPPLRTREIGRRLFDELQHKETFRCEQGLTTKDGDLLECELLCNTYREGRLRLIQSNVRDIAARKRAEEQFRVLVEGVKDYAIFTTDPAGNVVSWYPGAARILGYEAEEMIGRNAAVIFTPEDVAKGEAVREMATAVADGHAEDERWHMRKDGSRFFASGVLTPLWNSDGALRGFAKVMRDMTEKKVNEEAMREAQKLESIGLLAGGIAHDFNNLLTGIIGNASLAVDEVPAASPARRMIEEIITAGRRAADLTRQLLAYAGKGRMVTEAFSISEVVSEIIELIHASIPAAIRLEMDLQTGLPTIEADPSQIQQVAMNLVINAAEAIEGHGVIRVSARRRWLSKADAASVEELKHLAPGEYVVLEVEDSGTGMDEKTRRRIFEPFFTTKFTGRGLGLAAVAGIVRSQRGGIHVLTEQGQGTVFRIYFPVSTRRATRRPQREPVATANGAGLILVADDDEVVRRVASQALARRGYEVITAENGRRAVAMFRERADEVQLVVLDLAMPVMGGEEAYRELIALRPELPILVSSGYNEAMTSSRFGPDGMKAFIQKPFTAAQLAEKVRAILKREG